MVKRFKCMCIALNNLRTTGRHLPSVFWCCYAWLQLRFDYNTTTIRLRRIARDSMRAKMNTSIFRCSCVVVVSQSNRNCDVIRQEGHSACKNLHQKPMTIDSTGCGTVCGTLWQPHLPVSATEGATWKMTVKTLYMCAFKSHSVPYCVYLGVKNHEIRPTPKNKQTFLCLNN